MRRVDPVLRVLILELGRDGEFTVGIRIRPFRYAVLPDAFRELQELRPLRRGRLPILSPRQLAEPLVDRLACLLRISEGRRGLYAFILSVRHIAVRDGRIGEIRYPVVPHAFGVLTGDS